MATWSFKTLAHSTGDETPGNMWYWRHETGLPLAPASTELFQTLDECAADARNNGFRGTVVPMGDSLCHPIMMGFDARAAARNHAVRDLAAEIWV